MPFNDNLPAEGTDPWYTPLTTAWNNLKTFVNGLETGLAGKANTVHTHGAADVTSGEFTQARIPTLNASKIGTGVLDPARIPDLPTSKVTGLDTTLSGLVVNGGGIDAIRRVTQAEYDALTPDPDTMYVIKG